MLPASTGSAFYVSAASGSDSNPGTAAAPFRTIEHALNVATTPGSIVYVGSGTYGAGDTTSYHWAANGTSTAPITLSAAPNTQPVLAKLFVLTGSYLRLTGMKIVRNSYPTDTRFGQSGSNPGGNVGLWLSGCTNCQVDHDEITGTTESGLFISTSDGARILSDWIHGNGTTHDDHGIYFCSGSSGLVANNVIEHNYDFGLQLYCGSTYPVDPIVTANTIVYNGTPGSGGSGIVLEAQNAQVWNNVVANNVEFGIRGWTPGSGTIASNDVYGNGSGAYYGLTSSYTVSGDSQVAPQFVDAASGNYELQATSPLVNVGSFKYSPKDDRIGDLRPEGAGPDLGAYESH